MNQNFTQYAFSKTSKDLQERYGSREAYQQMEDSGDRFILTWKEIAFFQERDHFYLSTVGKNGWPYVQFRGGPPGFIKVLDEQTIAFADFRGNRQHISDANIIDVGLVAAIFLDYPSQTRLKVWAEGEVRFIEDGDPIFEKLVIPDYEAKVERAFIMKIKAYDWNCPQHIPQRYTLEEIRRSSALLSELAPSLTPPGQSASGATFALPTEDEAKSLEEDFFPAEVVSMRKRAEGITEFALAPLVADAQVSPDPGAYLEIAVRRANGSLKVNAYSLINGPADKATYNFAVQREASGTGGSEFMHVAPKPGDTLYIRPPENDFPLAAGARHSILIAGGIGVTPILSMARFLKAQGQTFEVHYAAKTPEKMAFQDEILGLTDGQADLYFSAAEPKQRIDLEKLLSSPVEDTHLYVCGPRRLIEAVVETTARNDWAKEQVHFELFGSQLNPEGADKAFTVELAKSGKTLEVPADQSLLDALLDDDVSVAFSCKRGECGTCKVPVLGGAIDHRDLALDESDIASGKIMLSCVSRAKDSSLKLDL